MQTTIEAPICNFNNIMIEITRNLHKIIFDVNIENVDNLDNIIFTDKSIVMFNLIKLYYHNDEMFIKIMRPIQKNELVFIANIHDKFFNVHLNFMRYIQMYNKIVLGYDDVPINFVNQIIHYVQKRDFLIPTNFSVPFKNKLLKNKNIVDCNNIYNFELLIKFENFDKKQFQYKIEKVYSSGLNQNNSLDNLKYIDKEILVSNTIPYTQTTEFIKNLFFYGQL